MSKEDKTDTGMGCAACQKRTQHRWYGNEWQCRECGSSPDALLLGLALAGACNFRDNLRTRLAAAEERAEKAERERDGAREAIRDGLHALEMVAFVHGDPISVHIGRAKRYLRDGDQAKPLAREHCAPRRCGCGAEIPESYYRACSACRARHEAEREQARFEAAEKLDPATYTGPVWLDGYGRDGYCESLEELLEECWDDDKEPPEYVYACTVHRLRLDPHDILASALEDTWEGCVWDLEKEFVAFVESWNAEQTGGWWEWDHRRVIVLTDEQKRRARETDQ